MSNRCFELKLIQWWLPFTPNFHHLILLLSSDTLPIIVKLYLHNLLKWKGYLVFQPLYLVKLGKCLKFLETKPDTSIIKTLKISLINIIKRIRLLLILSVFKCVIKEKFKKCEILSILFWKSEIVYSLKIICSISDFLHNSKQSNRLAFCLDKLRQ